MKGFTFIELLLVLVLITALITIFVYFINPVEILKKHRDIQRINDLKALEIAISSYLSTNPNADPDGIFEGTGRGEINQS
ncbi:MAG: prepilin-type N-terminal cleavage/methylation domain-containing protein, partial [Thermoproteota archaeon]